LYCSFIKLSRRITLEVSFSQEKYLFATQTNCLTIRLEKLLSSTFSLQKIFVRLNETSCVITVDNSTRILSTNQIYEIDQYGPITFVLKKLPRKFALVKIATKNFQQNVSTRIFSFLFYLFKALVPKLKIQLL
jgi:hypothetical protein